MKRRLNLITLILLLMGIILIPVLSQGYLLGKGAVQRVETLYNKSVSNNMESLSISLDFYVNHIEDYIRTLSQDQDIRRLLTQETKTPGEAKMVSDRIHSFTSAYRLRVPLYLQIIKPTGETYSDVTLHDTETVRLKQIVQQFPWFKERIPYDDKIIYRNVDEDFHDISSGHRALYFTKNIVLNGRELGLLVVEVNDTLFQRLLRKIQINDATIAFMGEDDGQVLISSENNTSDLQELWRQAIAKSNSSGGEYNSFHIDWKGQSYFCTIQNMPFLSWYLVAMTPAELLVSPTQQLWNHVLTVTGASILLITLILLMFIRKVMVPILKLSKLVRKIRFNEPGELEDGIWSFRYRGVEEIEILFSGIQQLLDRIKEQIVIIKSDEREKSYLELNLLQSQIRPHFLHNSINSIRWMAEMKGEKAIAQTLMNLSSMLNYTLSKSLTIWSTVGEELDYVKSYIAFQEKRMFLQIETLWEVQPEARHARILKLSLQPIVENAIMHGFAQLHGRVPRLNLICVMDGDQVRIEVIDNGSGMKDEVAAMLLTDYKAEKTETEETSGIGLKNVHRRLQLEYGKQYQMDIRSTPDKGTVVALIFPYKEQKGDNLNESDDYRG